MINIEEYKNRFAILLVDDNDNNLFTLTHRLQREGYKNLQVASNGTEALKKIRSEPYDLVLLDLIMPDIWGIDVLREIKDNPETEQIMVLMISGDDRIENVIDCIKLGAEDFLPKPFNVDFLRARVGVCLKKKWYFEKEQLYKQRIEFERQQYEQLLQAIFPQKIIAELTESHTVEPCLYEKTAVIFADIAGFTSYCSNHSPKEIFDNMQAYICLCEELSNKYSLEKIKTIGDSFMATAGMFSNTDNPVLSAVQFALELLAKKHTLLINWDLHIGIDFGSVIAGVVGNSKFIFDVWGDKVNTAARIEGIAEHNTVCLSKDAWELIKDKCEGKALEPTYLKGKGFVEIFEVHSIKESC